MRQILALTATCLVCTPLFLTSATVYAADWNLVLNGRAFHVDAARDWNESNLGLGIEREFHSDRRWVKVVLGNGFRDSQNHMSYMAGGGIKRRFRLTGVAPDFYVDVGAVGFMMTRHQINDNRPFPAILPAVTVGTRHLAVNLSYISRGMADYAADVRRYDASLDGILFLQLKIDARLFTPGRWRNQRLAAAEK